MKKIIYIILFYTLVGCNLSHKEAADTDKKTGIDTLYLMFYHDKHNMHKFSRTRDEETTITYMYNTPGIHHDKWFEYSSLKDTVFYRSFDYLKKLKIDIWDPLRIVNRIVEEDYDVEYLTSTMLTYSNPNMKRYFNAYDERVFYIVEPDYKNKRLIITKASIVKRVLL